MVFVPREATVSLPDRRLVGQTREVTNKTTVGRIRERKAKWFVDLSRGVGQ